MNCIARKASGKTTTLIELNVVVHVVVAVIVYGLWWDKPLAVTYPTLLPQQSRSASNDSDGKALDIRLLALLLGACEDSIFRSPETTDNCTLREPVVPLDTVHREFGVKFPPAYLDTERFEIRGLPDEWGNKKQAKKQKEIERLKIRSKGFILLRGQQLVLKAPRYTLNTYCFSGAQFLTEKTLRRWELQCSYGRPTRLSGFLGLQSATADPKNYHVEGSICTGGVQIVVRDQRVVRDNYLLLLAGALLSCLYAASHASAWSSHFPSCIEQQLWRGACICIASTIPVAWAFFELVCVYDRIPISSSILRRLVAVPVYSLLLLCWLMLVLYVPARLFIVVEAFISVRSLPIGAFDTVDWTDFWPHI